MAKSSVPLSQKFLLLGEIHGIRENVEVLKFFVKKYLETNSRFVVAFEWPSFLSGEINEYVSGRANALRWEDWDFVNDKDGRISRGHVELLAWLRKQNLKSHRAKRISVICFDENPKRWNERDAMMARNLKMAKARRVIAITGNFHARKSKFELDGEKFVPVGSHLPAKSTVAIKIDYLGGKFYNHGIKAIKSKRGARLGLSNDAADGFDYAYVVKSAHPVSALTQKGVREYHNR